MFNLTEILQTSLAENASDLHLSSGARPIIRTSGDLKPLIANTLDNRYLEQEIYSILTNDQREKFLQTHELDFVWPFNTTRLRINLFRQQHGISAAVRIIPEKILTFAELGLPNSLVAMTKLQHGLVIVSGATGSGKTTTLAALIEQINLNHAKHIITLEDPIEFLYTNKKSFIQQRQIYRDSKNFKTALRAALREDPDIILVGEMRDLETIRLSLTAAETGHLVFATLHSASAINAINRIIDVFPGDEKNLVRLMLADSLQTIICQKLVNKIKAGRTAVVEIMVATTAIRNLIRENKTAQIYSAMQTGATYGMQTLEQHLAELKRKDIIR